MNTLIHMITKTHMTRTLEKVNFLVNRIKTIPLVKNILHTNLALMFYTLKTSDKLNKITKIIISYKQIIYLDSIIFEISTFFVETETRPELDGDLLIIKTVSC